MKNKMISRLLMSLGVFGFVLALAPASLAIGIRPVREEISLPPGQSQTGEITVINETEKDFMAEPVIKVFYKTDESGIPVYANEDTIAVEDVRSWLDISTEPVKVPAKGSTVVKYTLNIPQTAEAGGKYMSIAYQPVKEAAEGVAVNVRAASLLLINVEGDIVKKGELLNFKAPENMFSDKPFSFETSFKNTGNTHLKPTGWIEILDNQTNEKIKEIARYTDPTTGEEVVSDKIPVNLTEGNVLPQSTRNFEGDWVKNVKAGEFKAVLNLTYDKDAQPITKEIVFKLNDTVSLTPLNMNTQGDKTTFDFTAKNIGNINQKLSGNIAIENTFGYKVDEIPLPEEMEYLAPGQEKNYKLEWKLENGVPEGRYTAKLNLNYGYGQAISEEISFGQADNTKIYLIGALVVVVLIAIIAIFKKGKKTKKD